MYIYIYKYIYMSICVSLFYRWRFTLLPPGTTWTLLSIPLCLHPHKYKFVHIYINIFMRILPQAEGVLLHVFDNRSCVCG